MNDLNIFYTKKSITKLQSGCRGQAAPPFNQLLGGRATDPLIVNKKILQQIFSNIIRRMTKIKI